MITEIIKYVAILFFSLAFWVFPKITAHAEYSERCLDIIRNSQDFLITQEQLDRRLQDAGCFDTSIPLDNLPTPSYGDVGSVNSGSTDLCVLLEGLMLISQDKHEHIGTLTSNSFDSKSLANSFGTFGNPFASKSIFNEFGTYGNPFSTYSPWNEFSSKGPLVVDSRGNVIGTFTVNEFKTGAIHPWLALTCFMEVSDDRLKPYLKYLPSSISQNYDYSPPVYSLPEATTIQPPSDIESPTNITDLIATVGDGQAVLQWSPATDNVGVSQYLITYDTKRIDLSSMLVDKTPNARFVTGNNASVTGLQNGITYYFYVIAFDAVGNYSNYWSNEATAKPYVEQLFNQQVQTNILNIGNSTALSKIQPPKNFSVKRTKKYMKVSWSNDGKNLFYEYFLSSNQLSQEFLSKVRPKKINKANLKFKRSKQRLEKTYYFYVRASDNQNNKSDYVYTLVSFPH